MLFKNRPALLPVILLIVGIIIGRYSEFSLLLISLTVLFLSLACLTLIYLQSATTGPYDLLNRYFFNLFKSSSRSPNFKEKNKIFIINFAFLALLLIVFGIFKITIDYKTIPQNNITNYLSFPEKIVVKGIAEDDGRWRNGKLVFPLDIEKLYFCKDSISVSGRALCYIKPDTLFDTAMKAIRYGDHLFVSGRLIKPAERRNPGEFDYRQYLEINDIQGILRIEGFYSIAVKNVPLPSIGSVSVIKEALVYLEKINAKTFNVLINKIRNAVIENIDKTMGAVEGAFLKGLLIGDRSELPEEVKESFMNAGVIHVLAVSGLNVAYLIIVLTGIIQIIPISAKFRYSIIILVLIFYMFLSGSSPSIVRATIMGIVYLTGKLMERKIDLINSMAFAALIILLLDSRQLFDLGFQLSFLCVLSLAYFHQTLKDCLVPKRFLVKRNFLKILLETIFAGIVILVVLFPLLSISSGKISIVGIFANIIIIPLANLSLVMGFLQVIFFWIFLPLGEFFAETNQFLLWISLKIINMAGSLDYAYFEYYSFNTIKIIYYYVSLFSMMYFIRRNKKFTIVLFCFLIMNWLMWFGGLSSVSKLRITFLDVGQGDASLLQVQEKSILIDAGAKNDIYDSGEKVIIPYLKRNGISKIDHLILTHPHDDHIGGAEYIINEFPVEEIILSKYPLTSQMARSLDSLIRIKPVRVKYVQSGETLEIGQMKIFILNPPESIRSEPGLSNNSIENNNSIVLKIEFGSNKILMTGDIEKQAEQTICSIYADFLKSDILKVAHHGSRNSSTQEFLSYVKPGYSILSLSSFNTFGFPSKYTLSRLDSNGTKTLRTDKEGAVIFESNGKTLKRIFWK